MLFKKWYSAAIPDNHINTKFKNSTIQTSVVPKLETMIT
jgi:hypothetical protein